MSAQPQTTTVEVIEPAGEIRAYDNFRASLEELKATNAKTHFDYETSKGNQEARSYVYKLRQTKSAVEKKRKEEKAESLAYGKRVDAEAREIMGDNMAKALIEAVRAGDIPHLQIIY